MKQALLTTAIAVTSTIFSSTSHAQSRVVSRANCASPTIPLLSPSTGITFNESISWDPKFWAGHYAAVTSEHIWERWVGGNTTGYWVSRTEAIYKDGSKLKKTWRAWAGKITPFRDVTIAGTKSGYRWVRGTHTDWIGTTMVPITRHTSAVNCNITTW